MPKTMRVTVEIEVDDLTPEDRKEANDLTMQEPPEELPSLADATANEAASALESLNENTGVELFAGGDLYLRYLQCRVIDAAWK